MRFKDIYIENVIITSNFGAEFIQTGSRMFENGHIYPKQGGIRFKRSSK